MKIFDLFFYSTYIILTKIGRSKENSKWSALLHTCVSSVFILIILLINNLFGAKNKWLAGNSVFLLLIGACFFIFYYIRYYKTHAMDKIEFYYQSLHKNKIRFIHVLYGIINILIIFLLFLFAFINNGKL